jgi:hypothetical protein
MTRYRNAFLAGMTLALFIVWESGYRAELLVDDDCYTDACVFRMCERELGRPCTDEDVFGKPQGSDEFCRPDETLPPCDVVSLRRT